jgi:gliding motility-associated-like protein
MLTSIGSGNPLVIDAPLTSTDYFVRFEGTCDTSLAVSVRVEALTGSVAPVTAGSDRDNTCPGDGMIVLSYSGGLAGNGAIARWYSDSALTLNIGSGNDLSIPTPMVSTPYFVRFEGACDTTGAVGFVQNVNQLSVAPVSAASDRDTICPGVGNIVLSYSGGNPGTGGSAEWYTDSLFSSHVGSGNGLILAAPPAATSYYVRFEAQCDTSLAVSVRVHMYPSPVPVFTETSDRACTWGMLSRYVVSGLPGSSFEWNVTGGTIVAGYVDSILVDWGNTPGTFDVMVREISKDGCESQFIYTQVSVGGPDVDLGPEQEICGEETVELIPTGNFSFLMWHDGSTGPAYTADTTELVGIQVFDEEGCTAYDSVQVNKYPMPVVNLGNDTSLCGQGSMMLDAGNPGAEYLWSSGATSRQIEVFAGAQLYWAEVTYGQNCTETGEITILECSPTDRFANIPNLITPNGDGRNDTWIFYEAADFPDIVVEIYDRWGKLVFRSEPGYSNPWDGRNMNGKEMPMDSYHYIIKTGNEAITGTVTIVR